MYEWKGVNVIGIPGVPARDLTDEEAEEYGVTESPLYVHKAERASSRTTRTDATSQTEVIE